MLILFDYGYFYSYCCILITMMFILIDLGHFFVDILGGQGINLLKERRKDRKLRSEAEHEQIHARVHGRVQVRN